MMKFYKFTSIPLLIGLVLSILFSYLFAGNQYYPLSPNSAMGQFYYQHLSEPIVYGYRNSIMDIDWHIVLFHKLNFHSN